MDEEVFNLQVRKFLKRVGITAQREIERSVGQALAAGRIAEDATLAAVATIRVPALGLEVDVEDTIALERSGEGSSAPGS